MINKIYYLIVSILLLGCLLYGIKLNGEINQSREDSREVFAKIDKLSDETQELSKKVEEIPDNFIFIIQSEEPKDNKETEKAEEQSFKKYDIPLSENLQKYTYLTCKKSGIDYEMVLAMMDVESNYNEKAISNTGDYGLMQINIKSQNMTEKEALDPETNIGKGVEIISNLMSKYEEPHVALMAYNCGENGAKKLWDRGIYSTDYSIKIMNKTKEFKVTQ